MYSLLSIFYNLDVHNASRRRIVPINARSDMCELKVTVIHFPDHIPTDVELDADQDSDDMPLLALANDSSDSSDSSQSSSSS